MQTPKIATSMVLILTLLPLAVDGSSNPPWAYPNEIEAGEILAKIQDGEPVDYDHVIVKGDLDLGNLKLPEKCVCRTTRRMTDCGSSRPAKIINSSIRLNDSTFEGVVDFSNAFFSTPIIDFSGANFTRYADFHGTTFVDYADFHEAAFREYADFQGVAFGGYANFDAARFNRNADFSGGIFGGDASFVKTISGGYAEFSDALFEGDAIFQTAAFREESYFGGAEFRGYTSFIEAVFSSYGVFEGATFGKYTDFDAARFSEEAYFNGAVFNGFAVFSDVAFRRFVEFSGTAFNGDVSFDGATFRGDAYFSEALVRGYFFGWYDIKNALICDEKTYLRLIRNFRDHSQFDEANDCCLTYRYRNPENLTENCTIIGDLVAA